MWENNWKLLGGENDSSCGLEMLRSFPGERKAQFFLIQTTESTDCVYQKRKFVKNRLRNSGAVDVILYY